MTSVHNENDDRIRMLEQAEADRRTRELLQQGQPWPSLERRIVFSPLTPPQRWHFGRLSFWALGAGCVALLALMIYSAGHSSGRPEAASGNDSGQLLCLVNGEVSHLVAVDPESGDRMDLGPIQLPAATDFIPDHEGQWLRPSPDGKAVVFADPSERSRPFGHRIIVRSTEPGASLTTIASPSAGQLPTSFAWSPNNNGLMYTANVLPPEMHDPDRIPTPPAGAYRPFVQPAAFQLYQVSLTRGHDGSFAKAREDKVWEATTTELGDAFDVGVAGWDTDHSRAALLVQSIRKITLHIVDTEHGAEIDVVPFPSSYTRDMPSPDGQWLAHGECARSAELCGADASSVWLVELATSRVITVPVLVEGARPTSLTWSGDGSRLAWVERATSNHDGLTDTVRVAQIGPNGPTTTSVLAVGASLTPALFSPDGTALLILEPASGEQPEQANQARVYPLDPAGSAPARLLQGWNRGCWGWTSRRS